MSLDFADGKLVSNYATVGKALRGVCYNYDTAGLAQCGASEQRLFAKRPGTR